MGDEMVAKFAGFIKTKALAKANNAQSYQEIDIRINPMAITSYAYGQRVDTGDEIVTIYVGGVCYSLPMTLKEVDDMMDEIERGFTLEH